MIIQHIIRYSVSCDLKYMSHNISRDTTYHIMWQTMSCDTTQFLQFYFMVWITFDGRSPWPMWF